MILLRFAEFTRVEFINWGGYLWDLFANCVGYNVDPPLPDMLQGFEIYDNFDDAQCNLKLRPEISVSECTVSGTCPDFTVSFNVMNTGCITVNVPVSGNKQRWWIYKSSGSRSSTWSLSTGINPHNGARLFGASYLVQCVCGSG